MIQRSLKSQHYGFDPKPKHDVMPLLPYRLRCHAVESNVAIVGLSVHRLPEIMKETMVHLHSRSFAKITGGHQTNSIREPPLVSFLLNHPTCNPGTPRAIFGWGIRKELILEFMKNK